MKLGHGIHQYLASKNGVLLADTPLTLAETASVFGEMLTFRSMLNKSKNKNEKNFLTSIEDRRYVEHRISTNSFF